MRRQLARAALVGWSLWLSACGALSNPSAPAPLEAPPTTPSPVAEVIFRLTVVAASPPGTAISLRLIDEVSGPANNATDIPLTLEADGTWTGRVTPPVDSVLRYRYVRTAPSVSEEQTALGEAAHDRLAVVSGSQTVSDVLAAWADAPFVGSAGRIVGTVTEAGTNAPLGDILVTAGGAAAFTDGGGGFRLEGLAPGLHTLGLLSPTGAHRPFQQGALVAAESATPATLSLEPASPVQVSFEVTVPSDTPPGAVLRLIGSTRVLGDTFTVLPGGQSVDAAQALPLVMVDATHYLALARLYAGTDLRYKYTLGDGYWSAERDEQGNLLTRQVTIPDHDAVLLDVISTWHAEGGSTLPFLVTAPAGTPAGESLSLQLWRDGWTSPLPMWSLGGGQWAYTLFAPAGIEAGLHYRYCRNQQCSHADDAATAADSEGRTLNASSPTPDVIDAWMWWDPAAGGATVVAPEIVGQPDFEAGYEVEAPFSPTWSSTLPTALAEMGAGGANAVLLTPSWTVGPAAATPRMTFDPAWSPFVSDLARQAEQARTLGMSVSVRPRLVDTAGSLDSWWASSPRNGAWWSVWFESYRSFVLTYAAAAERMGAARLILGGAEVAAALPGGTLADGSPSVAPADAETRWRSLLQEVRGTYHGRVAWELDFGTTLQEAPAFLNAFDDIVVAWHAPLGEGRDLAPDAMQAEAYKLLDTLLQDLPELKEHPLYLNVAYLSVDGGATGCAPAPDGTCRPPAEFASGAIVDPDLPVDLAEQSAAINAVLLAAYGRQAVRGFFVSGFNPAVALQDKSISVRGKPAEQMLGYWYPRLTGK